MKTTHYRKPILMVLLTVFIGVGVLAASVAQGGTLRTWNATLSVGQDGQGLHLAQPFGVHGPTLRLSNSMPDNVKRSLRAGGDRQIGAFGAENPDGYMFLEKRW